MSTGAAYGSLRKYLLCAQVQKRCLLGPPSFFLLAGTQWRKVALTCIILGWSQLDVCYRIFYYAYGFLKRDNCAGCMYGTHALLPQRAAGAGRRESQPTNAVGLSLASLAGPGGLYGSMCLSGYIWPDSSQSMIRAPWPRARTSRGLGGSGESDQRCVGRFYGWWHDVHAL